MAKETPKNKKNTKVKKPIKATSKSAAKVDGKKDLKNKKNTKVKKPIKTTSKSAAKVDGKKDFQKIGIMTFTDSLVSTTCDTRLHFHHPLWRDDLDYGL